MAWSNWHIFNKDNIDKYAPNNSGIYRISIPDGKFFKLENKKYWRLYRNNTSNTEEIKDLLIGSGSLRVIAFESEIYTDLAYIGKTDDLKERLNQHLAPTNPCLNGLIGLPVTLYFSTIKSSDIDKSENNFFGKFINATGGFCPPADNNSNECQRNDGKCLPIKYRYKKRTGSFDYKKLC